MVKLDFKRNNTKIRTETLSLARMCTITQMWFEIWIETIHSWDDANNFYMHIYRVSEYQKCYNAKNVILCRAMIIATPMHEKMWYYIVMKMSIEQ